MTYKIKNWASLFETAETRKLKRLAWVPVPNKHDGKGYRRILRFQDGPLVYAGWLLILQVASKCPVRGTLADADGPLTAADIADKTGFPVEYIQKALNLLVQKEIGWLECDEHQENLLESQEIILESQGRIEGNRSEENRTTSKDIPAPPTAVQDVNPVQEATQTGKVDGKALSAQMEGKPKRKANAKPQVNAWGAWVDVNRECGRKDPVPVGPDTQAGKQLAAKISDIEELKRIYRAYLDDRDPWIQKQGHPLRLLAGRVNKYANERYGIGIPGEEFMESEAV